MQNFSLKRLLFAPVAAAIALSGNVLAQGLANQGTGSFDGNFLKPQSAQFVSLSNWKYTFTQPSSSWNSWGYTAGSGWSSATGSASFNYGSLASGDASSNIAWPSNKTDLWARANFNVASNQIGDLMFWGRWDDNVTIYINGIEAIDRKGWSSSYRYLGISDAARAAISPSGSNVVAIHATDTGGGKHLNIRMVLAPKMARLPIDSRSKNNHFLGVVNFIETEMQKYGISAGAISIGRLNGGSTEILLSAGIGHMNKNFNRHVPYNAVFRLGSLDKPPADLLVQRMIADGVINPATGLPIQLSTRVFPMLDAAGLQPLSSGITDPRINNITIAHLLNHQSNLPQIPFDAPFYQAVGVAPGQITIEHNMRWLYSQQLLNNPGTPDNYNNAGFDVVRYMIDQIAPGGLESYSQQKFFPNSNHQLYIASGAVSGRVDDQSGNLLEPWNTTFIENDDGMELGSHGVLAASAEAYTRYFLPNPAPGLFYGAFDGTLTVMQKFQGSNGNILGFTAMFNMRDALPFRVWDNNVVIEENFDGMLEAMIHALPSQAWTSTSTGVSCSGTIQQWGNNVVPNCSLSIPSATNWSVGAYNGGSGWASYNNQELRININQPGSDHWHVQAVTPVNLSQAGDYIISFRARAESARNIVINVGHNGSNDNNWTSYAQRTVALSQQMQTFTLSLPSIPSDGNARLDFNAGNNGVADVFIDEVYLAPIN